MNSTTLLRTCRYALTAAAVSAVLFASGGCDRTTTTSDVLGPSHDLADYTSAVHTYVMPVKRLLTYYSPAGDAVYSKVIGPKGGKLVVSKSAIIVPRGAVDEDVVFSAHVIPGDTLHFSLNATRTSNGAPYGVFDLPVTIRINYDDVNVSNENALIVTYLVDGTTDGIKVGVPTQISKDKKAVTADLYHFSDYALGEN